ncbi:hypothetical protein V5O48_009980 [Marasmius crinis-equi]|uniref:Dienelactone hydrolase domain-containing protein n=1 Tax=Marasmius crinis-equi TaxID=585013 RepID=A0ABR3F9K7_9AGAR
MISKVFISAFAFLTSVQASFLPIAPEAHSPDTFQVLDGTPQGSIEKIAGVDTYVTLPQGVAQPKDEAILLLTDIFGLPLVNNKLLADDFARAGYAVFAPDYLNGDAAPADDPNFNLTEWLPTHGVDATLPPTRAVLGALREKGFSKVGVTGYCFGGLYTTLLSQTNEVEVAVMSHPSLLTIPDDIDVIIANSSVPVEIHSAELDTIFTPDLAKQVDALFAEGYAPGYQSFAYEGVAHGFAVRPANASDPVEVKAKELAFQRAVEWFDAHF